MTRILGIDLGTRRIGLAMADTETGAITPLATLRRGHPDRDLATLATVTREQRIEEVVVGLPRNTDGSEGPQALATRAWAEDVLGRLGVPYCWQDETFTSVGADETVGRARRGRSGGPPSAAARNLRRAAIDREAAVLILRRQLDARAGLVERR